MKKIFAVLVVICTIAFTINAQDAEYKELRYKFIVNEDGTSDYNVHKEIKLIRLRALSDFGETFVIYNPAFEEVTINDAYTLQADGTKVLPREDAVLHILPSSCTACGRFNNLREMVVVHTGLELGATIVLDYTVHRRTDILDQRIQLQQICPVSHFVLDVSVPQSQTLTVSQSTPIDGLPFDITATNKLHIEASNLRQTLIDSYMPAPEMMYNIISFNNGRTPQLAPVSDDIADADALLAELKKDSAMAYVTALRDFVRDNIRTNAVSPSLLLYNLAPASQVWQSGCGTPEEKAALLVSLLHRAGFQSTVDLSSPQSVVVSVDNMDYKVSVVGKNAPEAVAVAQEEVKTIAIEKDIEWNATELADGFYRFVIPTEEGAFAINAANLTSMRTAPLKAQQCDEQYDYTVKIPRGYDLVSKDIKESIEVNGVGRVEIDIRQKGRKLKIHRALRVEKDIITADDYADFRRIMQLWSQYRELFVKGK